MKRRGGLGIDAAFRSRQARPVSPAPTRKRREWTLREDRLLERHYGSMSPKELQRRFLKERTLYAIRGRAQTLGVARRTLHRDWTARERALVRSEFSRPGGLKWLIQALDRTDAMIASEARRLGLSRRRDSSWTTKEDTLLRRHYAVQGAQLSLEGRTATAIHHRAHRLGLRHPGIIGLSWSAAEDSLLRKHRHMQAPELASLLPERTTEAVRLRRNKIGMPYLAPSGRPNFRDRWRTAELKILQQHLESSARSLMHLLPGRSREAIKARRWEMRRRSKEQG